jgi:hypothetical protein
MLTFLVTSDINVAVQGSRVEGLEFGNWYYYVRPFVQPVFVLWALFRMSYGKERADDYAATKP